MTTVDTDPGRLALPLSRRHALRLGALAAMAWLGAPRRARASGTEPPDRSLEFYHVQSGESLKVTYWAEGGYVPDALEEVNQLLRDLRADEVRAIDVRLLDLLHDLGHLVEAREPFHVISGYRTRRTNALLRQRKRGVARFSLHTEGKAVDLHLPGLGLPSLHRAAVLLGGGGVGYYPRAGFIHLDVGPIRHWRG